MDLILAPLTFTGCVVAVQWSPLIIGVSMVLTMFCFCLLTLFVFKRELGNRIGPLLKCFRFPLLSSLFMLVVVALLRRFIYKILAPAATLVLCMTAGVVAYVSMAL